MERLDSLEAALPTGPHDLNLTSGQLEFARRELAQLDPQLSSNTQLNLEDVDDFLGRADEHDLPPQKAIPLYFILQMVSRRSKRTQILSSALLASAVGSFEVLVSEIARYFYNARPTALATGEKEFTLVELESFESIDDARQSAIGARVDSLMFKSTAGWFDWLKRNVGFGLEEIVDDVDKFVEIFQRRHIAVHNGSRVSRRYQINAPQGSAPNELGSVVTIDDQYLRDSLDSLLLVGLVASLVAIVRLDNEFADLSLSRLSDESYQSLLDRKWVLAKELTACGLKLKMKEADLTRFKVNNWIARDRLAEPIAAEVESLDVSAMEPVFRLAKAALLREDGKVVDALENAISLRHMDYVELCEWPLFYYVRRHDEFGRKLATIYASLDEFTRTRLTSLDATISKNSKRYHEYGCKRAGAESVPVLVRTAQDMGLEPCQLCARAVAETT